MTEQQQKMAIMKLLHAQGYSVTEAAKCANELLKKVAREYSLLYLDMDNVWTRVTAVYDSFEGVMFHAKEALTNGLCIRLITRAKRDDHWHIAKGVPPNDIRDGVTLYNVPK